ncbi:MAG: S41 family peptidase, partial [Chitinophagales bacterium]
VYVSMLLGPEGSEMEIDAENETGDFTVTIERTEDATTFSDQYYYLTDKYETYDTIECGYGYVNMGKITTSEVNGMYNDLKELPAIIIDIRNYPLGTGWNLVNKLMGSKEVSAILNQPDPLYAGTFSDPPYYEESGIDGHEPYAGKIYMLCNEMTQSQAEYTIMKLQSFPNHKVIGSQTAGADGNISIIFLPDSLETWFTTLEVLYPDSSQTQRVGVQIDSIVTPTIEGVRAGIDEVLKAALDCITGIASVNINNAWNIFPNPAQQIITVNIPASDLKTNRITISNIEGKIVLDRSDVHDQTIISITNLPVGLYLVSLMQNDVPVGTQKLVISR